MTNKTKLLPCPFCGTDDDINPAGVLNGDGTRSPECRGCGATAPTIATWNCRIAAPAEDVRAVGYASDNQLARLARGHAETCDLFAKSSSVLGSASALYRHPQRAVVLPERYERLHVSEYRAGWNACIDEFEKLNK